MFVKISFFLAYLVALSLGFDDGRDDNIGLIRLPAATKKTSKPIMSPTRKPSTGSPIKPSFTVTSTTFNNNAVLPLSMVGNTSCTGKNISPQLSWSQAPSGTKSYTLLAYDRTIGRLNWGLYNISVTNLPQNAGSIGNISKYGTPVLNYLVSLKYDGPCSPSTETHNYVITVFALSIFLPFLNPNSIVVLLEALQEADSNQQVLATASIGGFYH